MKKHNVLYCYYQFFIIFLKIIEIFNKSLKLIGLNYQMFTIPRLHLLSSVVNIGAKKLAEIQVSFNQF